VCGSICAIGGEKQEQGASLGQTNGCRRAEPKHEIPFSSLAASIAIWTSDFMGAFTGDALQIAAQARRRLNHSANLLFAL
jgi:hypothetical protein